MKITIELEELSKNTLSEMAFETHTLELLEIFAQSTDIDIRKSLAANPNTPASILADLAKDPEISDTMVGNTAKNICCGDLNQE